MSDHPSLFYVIHSFWPLLTFGSSSATARDGEEARKLGMGPAVGDWMAGDKGTWIGFLHKPLRNYFSYNKALTEKLTNYKKN